MNFTEVLHFVLRYEGGYVNNPVDRGGETKYGISKKSYPDLDIPNITKEQAAEIYRRDYWNAVNGDELPEGVNLVVFDTAVNSGVRTAIKILQHSVGETEDGILGPKTMKAITWYDPDDLAQYICWARMRYLAKIVKNDPSQSEFIVGWVNRVAELAEEVRI